MSTMSDRLRAFRVGVGLTQQQMARMCHIGKRTVIYWEMGEREIRCAKLLPLHQEYDLNFNWLITGNGDQYVAAAMTASAGSSPGSNQMEEPGEEPYPPMPAPTAPVEEDTSGGPDRDVLPRIERLRRR